MTQTEASLKLLAEKMQHAAATRAATIATANPGCLLQLRAGARLHNTNQKVLHVVELLDLALAEIKLGGQAQKYFPGRKRT